MSEMVQVSMNVPKELAPYFDNHGYDWTFEKGALLLLPYVQGKTISHGRAAELLGVRKWDLIEYYDSIGVPYLNQSKNDLMQDIETIDQVLRNKRT